MVRRGYVKLSAWVSAILRSHLTPRSVAQAVGIGTFIGCLPIYGLHIVACVAVARWLRLNQAILYGAANISNPLFAPFLVGIEIAIGELLRHGTLRGFDAPLEGTVLTMASAGGDLFLSCLLGSVVLGIALGAVLAPISHVITRIWLERRALRPAIVPRPVSPPL